ncbi:MAG: hypothetical protein ACI9VR_002893 [Cognaticolwellia sp.]|jgi:hypothetical protein
MEAPLLAMLSEVVSDKKNGVGTIWHGVESAPWEEVRTSVKARNSSYRIGRPRSAWLEPHLQGGFSGRVSKEQLSRSRLFSLLLLRVKQQAAIQKHAPDLLRGCSQTLMASHSEPPALHGLAQAPGRTEPDLASGLPTVDGRIRAIVERWWEETELDLGPREEFELTLSYRSCRRALRGYWAAAVLMPLATFTARAKCLHFDIQLLGNEFDVSWETCAHRLTTLKGGTEDSDVPALHLPDRTVTEQACVSRARRKGRGGHNTPHPLHGISVGCRLRDAHKLIYFSDFDFADWSAFKGDPDTLQHWRGLPLSQQGISCTECPRRDCTQRNYKFISGR